MRDARRAVAGAFVAHFVGFGSLYSFGVFFQPQAQAFGAGRGALGWVLGIGVATFLLFGTVSGPLADRYGSRPVVAAGGLLAGGGLVAAGRAQALWQLYVTQGLVLGGGIAFLTVPSLGAVGRSAPPARRALATGIAVTGSGVGTLAYAPVARRLIDAVGWRDAMGLLGAAGALLVVAGAAAIRDRAPHQGAGAPLAEAVRSRAFRLLWLAGLLAGFPFVVPHAHIVPYAQDHGVPPIAAAFVLSALGTSSVVGRLAWGLIAARAPHRRALAATALGMGLSFGLWLAAQGAATLVAFAVAFGFFQGGFITLISTAAADHFGTTNLAGMLGLIYAASAPGELLGPPAAGAIYDAAGSYAIPIVACAAINLATFAVLLRLPEPRHAARPMIAAG